MRDPRKMMLAAIGITAVLAACADDATKAGQGSASDRTAPRATASMLEQFREPLQTAVKADITNDPQLRAEIVLVRLRDHDLTAAAGVANPRTGQPIEPSASFRIASATKTFVAAAALKLVEADRFKIDDTIAGLLPAPLNNTLIDGGYRPDVITVRQLLTHTSGILDFTFGPGMDYVSQVIAAPQRRWTRLDQLELAMVGKPFAQPGDVYHYSDTGYGLLGAIIEQATGKDLGASLRSLLDYEQLGLDHTYLELVEPAPAGQPSQAHQFFGEMDTFSWSPTIDLFGGGGLVSTLDDLLTFFAALHEGRVFSNADTLDLMHEIPETNRDVRVPGDPTPYAAGAGIFRSDFAGTSCWSHEGFWGVRVAYCPALDSGFAISISQATRSASYNPGGVGAVLTEALTSPPS